MEHIDDVRINLDGDVVSYNDVLECNQICDYCGCHNGVTLVYFGGLFVCGCCFDKLNGVDIYYGRCVYL